jgi:hypothetical protein
VIADEDNLHALDMGVLTDYATTASLEGPLGPGYLITRGYRDKDSPTIFDRLLYFSSTAQGLGVVYYLEIVYGSGPYDGRWFYTTEFGDTAMLRIIGKQAESSTAPATVEPQAEVSLSPWLLAVAGALMAGWFLGTRSRQAQIPAAQEM